MIAFRPLLVLLLMALLLGQSVVVRGVAPGAMDVAPIEAGAEVVAGAEVLLPCHRSPSMAGEVLSVEALHEGDCHCGCLHCSQTPPLGAASVSGLPAAALSGDGGLAHFDTRRIRPELRPPIAL